MNAIGAADYHCVECCMRLFSRLPSEAFVEATLRSIENLIDFEHAKLVRKKWSEHAKN